jgi:peptide deformylase
LRYISDKKKLSKPCRPCERVLDGQVLGDRLLEIISQEKDAHGLTANQVGVNISVCAVRAYRPIVLINPKLVGRFGKTFFQEACLSFPGDYVLTERWTDIIVSADNHRKDLIFSFEKNALECICIQHEVDHINGITMFERTADMENLNGKKKQT